MWKSKTLIALAGAALVPAALVLVTSSPVADDKTPGVDFRMTVLEQAKKIHRMSFERSGAAFTLTVMGGELGTANGDGHHIVLGSEQVSRGALRAQLAGGSIESVSWSRRDQELRGTCDSEQECKQKTEQMCDDAGHSGVRDHTVQITLHADGSKTCSGDCESNGAVAFVTCNAGEQQDLW